jgi:hypothetical protein
LLGEALQVVTDHRLLTAPAANPAILALIAEQDVRPYRSLMPWAGKFAEIIVNFQVMSSAETRSGNLSIEIKG